MFGGTHGGGAGCWVFPHACWLPGQPHMFMRTKATTCGDYSNKQASRHPAQKCRLQVAVTRLVAQALPLRFEMCQRSDPHEVGALQL
eukprot:1158329-Pelagomonas_calceolata.AAC.10